MLVKKKLCVPAGSLLMMDVGCIHGGAPQEERTRSVLMNYSSKSRRTLFA